jgi:hypothetical protein
MHAACRISHYRTSDRIAYCPRFVHPASHRSTMKYIAGYEPDPKPRSAEKRDIGAYSSRVRRTGVRGFVVSGVVVSWCVVYADEYEYEHQFACVQVRSASVKAVAGGQRGGEEGARDSFFFVFFYLLTC